MNQHNTLNSQSWQGSINGLDQIEAPSGDIRDCHYCKKNTVGVDIIFPLTALTAIPYPYVVPDYSLQARTGWKPSMPFQMGLRACLEKNLNKQWV